MGSLYVEGRTVLGTRQSIMSKVMGVNSKTYLIVVLPPVMLRLAVGSVNSPHDYGHDAAVGTSLGVHCVEHALQRYSSTQSTQWIVIVCVHVPAANPLRSQQFVAIEPTPIDYENWL